jgi:hypothetical protein
MAISVRSTTENMPSVLPEDLAAALFDHEARRVVGLSAEQFLAKWDAGEYGNLEDSAQGREIAYLVLLIPFGRRHS